MKNWMRIFLVSSVLIGGTTYFGIWSVNQYNDSLDKLMALCGPADNFLPLAYGNGSDTDSAGTVLAEVSEVEPALEISSLPSEPSFTFVFPKENTVVYSDCTYQISFQSSVEQPLTEEPPVEQPPAGQPPLTIGPLKTALVHAASQEVAAPEQSGLAGENGVDPTAQNFSWTVGSGLSGQYYVSVSDASDIVLNSGIFTIVSLPSGIAPEEKEKICAR